MKKSLLFCLMSSLILLTSCKIDIRNIGDGNRIEPSANIVKKTFPQDAFNKVDIEVVANVKFIQSNDSNYKVTISAPENYIELFKLTVNNNELNVDFVRNNVNIEVKNVDVTIYSPTLSKLENSGVANVEVDYLSTDELTLDNTGVGKLFFSGLIVRQLNVECSGVGGVELSGNADYTKLVCSGVGSIDAQDLIATHVEAEVSGVGGITCHAKESIKGDVSGVGSLKYAGTPPKHDFTRTGVGKIEGVN